MHEDRSLELDGSAYAELVGQVVAWLSPFLDGLADEPARYPGDAVAAARAKRSGVPEGGRAIEEVLAELFEEVFPHGLNPAHPGFMAYIPGGGQPYAGVADLVSSTVNRYVGTWFAAPVAAQLEANVVRWFCTWVGYGEDAGGVLTSGGSLANLVATVTARRERLGDDIERGVVYTSDQAHASVQRAALVAGIAPERVRSVPSDDRYRLDVEALAAAIAEDRSAELEPFLVVAAAGTTNTGAVDPLPRLADLCETERLWLHVDAAYGGFFVLTAEGRARLAGMERADSITLDPHKTLFLPYGTGAVLVRDREALGRAHALEADYLPAREHDDLWDFSELSPELTRPFRGLRVWLPLQLHGLAPFRANLEEKWALARLACERLRALAGLEIVAEPELSLFAFRVSGPDRATRDRRTKALLEAVNARGRVHLSGTRLRDGFVARVCIVVFRTHREHVEAMVEDVEAALAELAR